MIAAGVIFQPLPGLQGGPRPHVDLVQAIITDMTAKVLGALRRAAQHTIIDPGALDAGHWVHRYVKDLETASFDIELIGPGKVLKFEPGPWLWGPDGSVLRGLPDHDRGGGPGSHRP
jgi:hypothetical protein